jgi:uncharacterized protein YndB with AHSA1/START domain
LIIPPASHNSATLVLRRTFAASRQRVFRAWIEPEALERWLKPRGMRMTVSKLEAHTGGSFRFELENGSCIAGTYLQIAPPEKLVFTWSGEAMRHKETIVTLEFHDQGPLTEVVLTHERLIAPEQHALAAGGWPSLLDALAEVLSSHLDF